MTRTYWGGFDPTPYTQEQFAAHVASIPLAQMQWCKYLCLHNTSEPTLAQWVESGPAHDARLKNLESYYQKLGWHQGPHGFISRNFINGFSPFTEPGIHASCFNSSSIGLECVGEYNTEPWDSGDGALVRDNAVFAMAVLHNKLGLRPDGFVYGRSGLHFHRDCVQDHHDCPGSNVHRPDVVARVIVKMAELNQGRDQ